MAYRHVVRVSQAALLEMILSGVTAYEAERRRMENEGEGEPEGELYVETGGHLWGYSNPHPALSFHYIEHVSISVFATRKSDSIAEHAEEVGVKRQLMSILRPELRLLGDFHTHPYSTLKEAKEAPGWEPSPQDRHYWLHHSDDVWEASGGRPINLILAICPDRKAPQSPRPISGNTCQFGLGEFRFWLTAIVGEEDDEGRRLTRNRSASVALWPLSLESITGPGDSIREFDPVQAR